MAITHKNILQEQDPNQPPTCSDCGPTCPYKCTYPEFYWPPQPPPIPPHPTPTPTHISPYAIIILTLLGSAFLFFTYYLIMVRCSTRFRRTPPTQILGDQDFSDDERGIEVDHPIWYINTIGLQPSVINSISVFNYKKDEKLIEGADCSVCLSEFQENEILRLLPKCNHAFHVHCIDTWLSSHTNCPLCRCGILSNSMTPILGSDYHNFLPTSQLIENLETDSVAEVENCDEDNDSKTEYESVTGAGRSISMHSITITDVVIGELETGSSDSIVDMMMLDREEI